MENVKLLLGAPETLQGAVVLQRESDVTLINSIKIEREVIGLVGG